MTQSLLDNPTIWVGDKVRNYSTRNGKPVKAIVQHCMGRNAQGKLATMGGTKGWFENPKSEVSAHFGISLAGEIWQFVAVHNMAWANGIVQLPDLSIPWLADCVDDKDNPNWFTISIENEGDGVMPMPDAQYKANRALTGWLLKVSGLKAGPWTIIRHSQITGIERANCPGLSFPMTRLRKELSTVDFNFTDPITKFAVSEPFAAFYVNNGGLSIFGRPITATVPGPKLVPPAEQIQWFERARFELRNGTVMLGLVGHEAYAAQL